MKIGDKVKFLNEIGEGTVAGFKGNNIVLVEDSDGFQIPVSITDVVVAGENDEYTSIPNIVSKGSKSAAKQTKPSTREAQEEPENRIQPSAVHKFTEERKGGDVLNCYLAFVPANASSFETTEFECYFVNDSNYYVRYLYLAAEGQSWHLRSTGEVEPNTKFFIEDIKREDLNDYGRISLQLLAYKRDKNFMLKPTVDAQLRIDNLKFYKLHAFTENDFFEQNALLYPIVENDKTIRPLVIDPKELKKDMYSKESDGQANSEFGVKSEQNKHTKAGKHAKNEDDKIVVDLHASSLLETTAGMSAADILNYQIDVFRKTLEEHRKDKGKRIIFIHGKGEGVLRQSIVNELKYRYKNYPYQDASFQEYGYGATQVTIR